MSLKDTCISSCDIIPVTINNGTSLSSGINLGGLRLFGLAVPSSWTSAGLSFQISTDAGTTWYELLNQDGSAVTATATASGCLMVDPKLFAPHQHIKIRSGTSTSPINQGADRVLQIILRAI